MSHLRTKNLRKFLTYLFEISLLKWKINLAHQYLNSIFTTPHSTFYYLVCNRFSFLLSLDCQTTKDLNLFCLSSVNDNFSPYIEGEAEAGIIKQMTETFYEQLRRRRMNSSHYVVLIGLHLLHYLNKMCCILIHLLFNE